VIDLGFIGPAYVGRSRAIDSQRCINWYLESNRQDSRTILSLAPTGGLSLLETPAGSPSRGTFSYDGEIFTVHGDTLYHITTGGTVTTVATTLDTNTGNVSFAENGAQLMIVDGTSGYIYTKADGLMAKITDADFPASPEQVVFIDGYFIVNSSGTGKFYASALNDGTSWAALVFATAEGFPDNLVSMIVLHRRLWLFGDRSMEIWYNSGAQDFPFARVHGSVIEEGIVAQWSVAKDRDNVFWLSSSPRGDDMVMMSSGAAAQRISTNSIELQMDSYSDTSDAIGNVFHEEGHVFYVLTFPTGGETWVYDVTESKRLGQKIWHQRKSSGGRWLAQHMAFVGGLHYVSDYNSGNIYQIGHDILSENGTDIIRTRAGRHITKDRNRIYINSFEVVFEMGIGNATVADPQIMLRISKDGGFTWGNEKWASAGKVGEYLTRAKFNRLGLARDWVFEISVSDQVDWNMVKAVAE